MFMEILKVFCFLLVVITTYLFTKDINSHRSLVLQQVSGKWHTVDRLQNTRSAT